MQGMNIKIGRKYRLGGKVFLLKDIAKTLTDLDVIKPKVIDSVICEEIRYNSATEELKNSINDSALNGNVIFSMKDFKENMIPLEIDFNECIYEYCMGRISKYYIVKNIYRSKNGENIVEAYRAGDENEIRKFFAEIGRRGMIKPVEDYDNTREYYFLSENRKKDIFNSLYLEGMIKILKTCVDKISKVDISNYPIDFDLEPIVSETKNFCENLVRSLKA